MTAMEKWDEANRREEEARAVAARDAYKDALRSSTTASRPFAILEI
jgi:hypothetical protein